MSSSYENCPSYAMAKAVSPFLSCSGQVLAHNCRPIEVQYFIKHSFLCIYQSQLQGVINQIVSTLLQYVNGRSIIQYMGKPVQIFCKRMYEATVHNTMCTCTIILYYVFMFHYTIILCQENDIHVDSYMRVAYKNILFRYYIFFFMPENVNYYAVKTHSTYRYNT